MTTPPRVRDYLLHILEAVQRIEHYTAALDQAGFRQSTLVQDAVIRNIEIVGEACNNIRKREPAFAQQHAEVPWTFAIGMRNVLSHGYFRVDLEAVWQTLRHDLPQLKHQIEALAREL